MYEMSKKERIYLFAFPWKANKLTLVLGECFIPIKNYKVKD